MKTVPSAPIAALSLVIGYAVAAGTGVRALGGLVLLIGLAVCWVLWIRRGTATAVTLVVAFAIAFAGSHVLALLIGAWPSVLVVAAVMAAMAWRLADRHGQPTSVSQD
jgi:hypothetical protein